MDRKDSLTTGAWVKGLEDMRRCFIFYSVGAGGSCGDSLPNVDSGGKNKRYKICKMLTAERKGIIWI